MLERHEKGAVSRQRLFSGSWLVARGARGSWFVARRGDHVGRPLQINGSRDSCISPHVRAPTRLNLSGPFGPPLLAGEAKSFPSASP